MIGFQLSENDHSEHVAQYLWIRWWKWRSSSDWV